MGDRLSPLDHHETRAWSEAGEPRRSLKLVLAREDPTRTDTAVLLLLALLGGPVRIVVLDGYPEVDGLFVLPAAEPELLRASVTFELLRVEEPG